MAAWPVDLEGVQDDFIVLPSIGHQPLDPNSAIDVFLASIDQGATSDELQFGSLDGRQNEYLNMDILATSSSLTTSSPSSLSTELNGQDSWRGSTEISAAKRNQLVKEAGSVISQVSYRSFWSVAHSSS